MAFDAGICFIQIAPSFRGVQQAIGAESIKWGASAGKAFSDSFNKTVQRETNNAPLGPAEPTTRKQGDKSGGTFADAFKRRVEAALKALPPAQIGAATNEAEQKIKDLRNELLELSSKKIGVDITDAEAIAKLDDLKARLAQIGAESASVQIKVDAAAAEAQLAAVQAEVAKLGASDPTINVDVDSGAATASLAAVGAEVEAVGSSGTTSAGGISFLMAAGISLGPAIIPVAGAAAAAIAAIGTAAFGAVAGAGVLALAFHGVFSAVSAMGEAQKSAGGGGASLAQHEIAVAGALDQVKAAEASLANARANAATATAQAAQRVQNAETALAQAQVQAKNAQAALTQAREDAKRSLEDLNLQVEDGALAQRQANIDVENAKKQLDVTLANPRATQTQRAQAQLTYDQAVQQVTDLGVRQKRLVEDQAAANKAGIDGSQQVQAAQQNIAQTTAQVAKAQQDLGNARVAEGNQARQSAFTVAQAQQGVISAQRSLRAATLKTGAAGATAATNLATAMSALTPAGQEFAKFLFGLKPLIGILEGSAQNGVLPGLERAIKLLLPFFPAVNTFVGQVATIIGQGFGQIAQALTAPFWKQFFRFLGGEAIKAISNFAPVLLDVAKGFAGLFEAFAPVGDQVLGGVAGLAKAFGNFGEGASKNKGLQSVISYITINGPKVFAVLRDMARVAGHLVTALAPLGSLILDGLVALFGWLANLSPGQLIAVAAGITAIGVALAIAFDTNPVGLIITAITLLVGGIVYAWKHCETFRNIVSGAFKGIAKVAGWLWNNVLKPVWDSFVFILKTVVIPIVLWLWHKVIEPAFKVIGAVISLVWKNVIKPAWESFVAILKNVVIPIVLFLWHNVIQPAFKIIGAIIEGIWKTTIKPIFQALASFLKNVVFPVIHFLWNKVIKPVFEGVGKTISVAWNKVIKPIFEALGNFIHDKVKPAFEKGVAAIGKAWDGIKAAAKVPIKFVIETVINNGIIDGFNWLAGHFGVPAIPHIPLPSGFSSGGVVPGYAPRRDTVPAMLSEGEGVMVPEFVRHVGANQIHSWNKLAMSGRLPKFGIGGIVSGIGDALSSVGGAIAHPLDFIKKLLSGPLRLLDQITNTPFGRLVAGLPRKAVDGLIGTAKSIFGFDEGGMLQPGLSLAFNGTQRPEPILTGSQWASLTASAQGQRSGRGGPDNALNVEHFHAAPDHSPRRVAEEMMWLLTARG